MPDQHDRVPGQGRVLGEEVVQVSGVLREAAQRVGRRVHGEAVILQAPDDPVPAGAIRPRAMLQHDHRLRRAAPVEGLRTAGAGRGALAGEGQQAGHSQDGGEDDQEQPCPVRGPGDTH